MRNKKQLLYQARLPQTKWIHRNGHLGRNTAIGSTQKTSKEHGKKKTGHEYNRTKDRIDFVEKRKLERQPRHA